MVSTPTRIPAPAIRNPPPTIMQAAATDFRISVAPKPATMIPPAMVAMLVTPREKITAAITTTTANNTASALNISARLTAQRTRIARRMILPGERFFFVESLVEAAAFCPAALRRLPEPSAGSSVSFSPVLSFPSPTLSCRRFRSSSLAASFGSPSSSITCCSFSGPASSKYSEKYSMAFS